MTPKYNSSNSVCLYGTQTKLINAATVPVPPSAPLSSVTANDHLKPEKTFRQVDGSLSESPMTKRTVEATSPEELDFVSQASSTTVIKDTSSRSKTLIESAAAIGDARSFVQSQQVFLYISIWHERSRNYSSLLDLLFFLNILLSICPINESSVLKFFNY